MKLVKIDDDLYLNSDFIASIEADGEKSTFITMINGGTCSPNVPIKKVLDAIYGSEEHLVNDASMNILKAESINSGHLNQQKYPSR